MAKVNITELDVDGLEVKGGILLIGKATFHDGQWLSLANVNGMLSRVQLKVTIPERFGRETPKPRVRRVD